MIVDTSVAVCLDDPNPLGGNMARFAFDDTKIPADTRPELVVRVLKMKHGLNLASGAYEKGSLADFEDAISAVAHLLEEIGEIVDCLEIERPDRRAIRSFEELSKLYG